MKNIIKTILLISIFFFSSSYFCLSSENEEFKYHRGKIIEILAMEETEIEGIEQTQLYMHLKVHLLKTNEFVEIETTALKDFNTSVYEQGDRVIVSEFVTLEGQTNYSIVSYDRQNTLLLLFGIFLVLALIISSKRTLGAVTGLLFSFFIIFSFLIPKILSGANPILFSILAASIMIPVNFYLSHGLNKKTTIAIVSTIIALIITGLLALLFMSLANITGQGLEETITIVTMVNNSINIEGLLLAGIIIGTLGVLDDITISQVAIVQQISEVGKKLDVSEVFLRAMNIGRDHMASMINTLVLVYTGASMPLLIIFVNAELPLNYVLGLEVVAIEIVRTLVGSIGLLSAIPISTFLATIVFKEKIKLGGEK